MDVSTRIPIQEAIREARRLLEPVSDTAGQDAALLLAHILHRTRSWVLAHADEALPGEVRDAWAQAHHLLEQQVPLPYILGHWEFHGLDFLVNEHVLIPRPETELLVDAALHWLTAHPACRLAADVGTGSGCIAISLAARIADLVVYASDVSGEALRVAADNARSQQVQARVIIRQASLLAGLPTPVDLICANLPYIPSLDCRQLLVSRHEPSMALDGGEDGLSLIRGFLNESPSHLKPGGLILVEIEVRQGEQVIKMARDLIPEARVDLQRDHAGLDRLVSIRMDPVTG